MLQQISWRGCDFMMLETSLGSEIHKPLLISKSIYSSPVSRTFYVHNWMQSDVAFCFNLAPVKTCLKCLKTAKFIYFLCAFAKITVSLSAPYLNTITHFPDLQRQRQQFSKCGPETPGTSQNTLGRPVKSVFQNNTKIICMFHYLTSVLCSLPEVKRNVNLYILWL